MHAVCASGCAAGLSLAKTIANVASPMRSSAAFGEERAEAPIRFFNLLCQ